MTQIANVRRFNGSSDYIRFTSTDVVGAYGPSTWAAIVKSNISADVGDTDILACSGGSGGRWAFVHQDAAAQVPGLTVFVDSPGVGVTQNNCFTPAMGWCIVGAAIKSTPNDAEIHTYEYDNTTWTHINAGSGTVLTGSAPAGTPNLYIGSWDAASEWFNGDVAVVGFWKSTFLSQANFLTLTDNIASWEALSPTCLWLLDQTAVTNPVLDRINNADEVARSGTSVVTPTGLTFDVGGAPVPPVDLNLIYLRRNR
jgi:hypothetical protein